MMNRLFLRLACLAFVVAMALRCDTGNPFDPDSSGNPPGQNPPPPVASMASIRGTVTGGDSLVIAMVSLTGAGITRTAWTAGSERTFTFDNLPPGVYTMTAAPVGFGFACQSASADLNAGETVTTNIACIQAGPGAIAGTVTAGGSPVPGIAVHVTRAFRPTASAITGPDGAFTVSVPSGGPYAVAAAVWFNTCESASSVMVEEDRTVTVSIVCQPVGAITGVVRWTNGSPIPHLYQVSLNGPVGGKVQASAGGGFGFYSLPPGDYTVTATVMGCGSVAGTVKVANLTSVEIVCDLPDFREIAGDFFFYLPRENEDTGQAAYSQYGDCPPPLPAENTRRLITYDPVSDRFSIVGLDPDLTIVGNLHAFDCQWPGCQETHRAFDGTGSAVRPDGSSIRSDLTGRFGFATYERGYFHFYGRMTREHSDSGGGVVCTETYEVGGSRVLP